MLPNLTQQQQMLYQMLQLQMIPSKSADLMTLYQACIMNQNIQQLNPYLSLQSIQPQPMQVASSSIIIPTVQSPSFYQQQQQQQQPQFQAAKIISTTPSPSISPNAIFNDSKRRAALTINDLLEAIPPLKRPCLTLDSLTLSSAAAATTSSSSSSPLITIPTPTSSSSSSSSCPIIASVSDNNNETSTAPASIKSRSESGSISDSDEFIDVVGDPVPKTKAQRKAHIEFYRKMKLLRNREKKLQCALCNEIVKNVESNVRAHIISHTDASSLICKICCFSTGDLPDMFEHMGTKHPSSRDCYDDRRNMTQLSEVLSTCFPRGGVTKQRTGFFDSVQKVVDFAKKRNESYINCGICQKDIQATKEVITRHMNSHHVFRCKKCKSICHDEEEMQAHCQKSHKIEAPKNAIDYHLTAAADAVGCVFKKCFEKYLKDS